MKTKSKGQKVQSTNYGKRCAYQVRSENAIVSNSYLPDGTRLKPKESLEALEGRRLEIITQLARGRHSNALKMELQCVMEEIQICYNYFKKRCAAARRNRDRNKQDKLHAALRII